LKYLFDFFFKSQESLDLILIHQPLIILFYYHQFFIYFDY